MNKTDSFSSLEGKFILAMPSIPDKRFQESVILLCTHTKNTGAMGVIINTPHPTMTLFDLMTELHIESEEKFQNSSVYIGGPERINSGYIIHSNDYISSASSMINTHISMALTQEILYDISLGKGPLHSMITFGCCSWSTGQLEEEMLKNNWIVLDYNHNLMFEIPYEKKWQYGLSLLEIEPCLLSNSYGRA